MAEKTCISCATQNPSHFEYCKHCGAPLPVVDKVVWEEPVNIEHPDFGEVSYQEYNLFVGGNADSILSDLHASRSGLCLPVLLLGMFFGFAGMSVWFFYRKLKKAGFILLFASLALMGVEAFLNAPLNKSLVDFISQLSFESASPEILSSVFNSYGSLYLEISRYIGFVASFFMSAFALKIYKKESYKRILSIKESYAQSPAIPLELMLKLNGGVSIGLVFVPVIANLLAAPVFFLVSLI